MSYYSYHRRKRLRRCLDDNDGDFEDALDDFYDDDDDIDDYD